MARRLFPWVSLCGLLVYLATAYFNIGIIALDDYDAMIARAIPAQTSSTADLIEHHSLVRSAIPSLILLGVAKTAWHAGITDPINQLRAILILMALYVFLTNLISVRILFPKQNRKDDVQALLSVSLLGFYFLCPLFLTRPMEETLSLPLLTLSGALACRYWIRPNSRDIALSIFILSVSAMLRFHTGICAVILVTLILLKHRWRDFIPLLSAGTLGFLLTGILDALTKGSFHQSLISYVQYNVEYSSTYGVPSYLAFIYLFLGLSIPPTFISRFKGFQWARNYERLFPAFLYFIVFLMAHTVVPHKEERFVLPVLPLFLFCLVPLLQHFWASGKKWRVVYFVAINAILMPLASFNIAQNNIISLGRFVDKHPGITSLLGVDETLLIYPEAYFLRPISRPTVSKQSLSSNLSFPCTQWIAIRSDIRDGMPLENLGLTKIAEFSPGILESIVVRLNPGQNRRRGKIELYMSGKCVTSPQL